MHELLLQTTIPSSRHHQVLSVLAGIAAMQPVPIHEQHFVFKPLQQPAPLGRVNANQAVGAQMKGLQGQMHGDLFYLKVVGEIPANHNDERKREKTEDGAKNGAETTTTEIRMEDVDRGDSVEDAAPPTTTDTATPTPMNWTLQYRDLPDPSGRRPVTSRAMLDTPLIAGSPLAFMTAMEYTQVASYVLRGYRLTHNAVDIRVYRLLFPASSSSSRTAGDDDGTKEKGEGEKEVEKETLLDPSGSYILQTAVKVQDSQNVDRMQEGVRQLMELKEVLKGCVELEVGERLAFDTRVR